MNFEVFYINENEGISESKNLIFDACMQAAVFEYREYNEDNHFIDTLGRLLNGESFGIGEMASIQISLDEEPVDPICIEHEFPERPYIVFNYGYEYLVMKLDRGIQLMVDWCYQKLTFEPDSNIAILLEKLKAKYVSQ